MKKLPYLIFCSCLMLLLQACIPILVAGGVAAGGVLVYDNRTPKAMYDDRDISYRAQIALSNNKEINEKAHITLAVFNRVVLLVGQAPTPDLKTNAENIVKTIPKVKRVHNDITIEEPVSSKVKANDTWITTKVKSEFAATKGLYSVPLKIVTENGVVYLMGVTTKQQGNLASEIARKVEGVKKVVKLFEYSEG